MKTILSNHKTWIYVVLFLVSTCLCVCGCFLQNPLQSLLISLGCSILSAIVVSLIFDINRYFASEKDIKNARSLFFENVADAMLGCLQIIIENGNENFEYNGDLTIIELFDKHSKEHEPSKESLNYLEIILFEISLAFQRRDLIKNDELKTWKEIYNSINSLDLNDKAKYYEGIRNLINTFENVSEVYNVLNCKVISTEETLGTSEIELDGIGTRKIPIYESDGKTLKRDDITFSISDYHNYYRYKEFLRQNRLKSTKGDFIIDVKEHK